jgi:hypothetical protein
MMNDYPEKRAMPISENVFDSVMKQMIALCQPEVVLDIGPGAGKYGRMLCDIEMERGRAIHKTCIEIANEKVIQRFNLHSIYNEIINDDAATIVKKYPSLTGDLAIAGDVIEHMTKSEGVDLIEYPQYRFKYVFLVIPIDWISYSYEDYDYESHISIWRTIDIERFEGGYCVERLTDSSDRFLLCSINGITIPRKDHFVVRNKSMTEAPPLYDANLEFGFLNRPSKYASAPS